MIAARLFAALFIIGTLPAAHAAAPQDVLVSYGDLDLATDAGRTELTARLDTAAAQLCSPVLARAPDSEPSIREHQVLYRACTGRLRDRAMAKVKFSRNGS